MLKIKEVLLKFIANINDYLLLLMALIIIFGAAVYYLYALNWWGTIIALILTMAVFLIILKYFFQGQSGEIIKKGLIFNKKNFIYLLFYGLFYLIMFFLLIKGASDRALISPWQVIDNRFFVYYLISSLLLIFLLIQKKIGSTWKLGLLSLHYFLSLAVAVLVYKIGYGFDPFIHQATMELIDQKGLVTPKPPYYLGEYSLIIILHKISGLAIYWLNKLLVPLTTALFLPLAIYKLLSTGNEQENSIPKFLSILFLLALTFSPFIVTTPQNLSYLFLLLAVLLGYGNTKLTWILIISLATLAIHPLTGLPALAWTAWLVVKKYQTNLKKIWQKILLTLILIVNSLAIPLALFLVGGADIKKISWGGNLIIEPLKNIFTNLSSAGQETWLLNFVYFFYYNYNLFLLIIIIASLIYFWRKFYSSKIFSAGRGLFWLVISLLVAYILSSQIRFNDLINYEQSNYANRLLVIIIIFCLPLVILAFHQLIKKIWQQNKLIQIIWLIIGLALITTALYVSYPRFDKYFNSRGYSTSRTDLEAVRLIDQKAQQSYLVLANQQVAVAALWELGFDHYYPTDNGLIYFYPIPTGGPLYQYYLDMVYKKPDQSIMKKALDLVGVDEGYLVINKYWHQSGQIINEAKLLANDWLTINNGEIYIFRYHR